MKWLVLVPIWFVIAFMTGGVAAATSPCAVFRPDQPYMPVDGLTGWHDGFKCYNGTVVDFRE